MKRYHIPWTRFKWWSDKEITYHEEAPLEVHILLEHMWDRGRTCFMIIIWYSSSYNNHLIMIFVFSWYLSFLHEIINSNQTTHFLVFIKHFLHFTESAWFVYFPLFVPKNFDCTFWLSILKFPSALLFQHFKTFFFLQKY